MPIQELRQAYASGELVVFVGAGISTAAGLPSRSELVEHMLAVARDFGLYPSQLEEIEQLLADGQLLDALSDIESALTPVAFTRAIKRALDDTGRPVPPLATALAQLTNLRGVVTTNLDRLLERAFAGRWPSHARPIASLAQARGWIFKLHGTLGERDTWVLTRAEYRRAVYNDPLHQRLVEALFLATPVLFVGHAFSDPDFAAVLGRVAALAGDQPPNHFALVDAAGFDDTARRRLSTAGIRAIPHTSADECLRLLADAHDQA